MRLLIGILLLGSTLPASAPAQVASNHWDAWVGCWQPVGGAPGAMTCVLPGDTPAAAQIVTYAGDSAVQRSVITADGSSRALDVEGCAGKEIARFSGDGSQVFVNGELRCGDGPLQVTSGVFSISETGQWIDVHVVRVGEQRDMRVRRSRSVQDVAAMPEGVRGTLAARGRAGWAARVAAARPVSLPRLTETSAAVDGRVVEAWLLESSRDGSRVEPLDARGLEQLDAANVPARVIDVMVALGYPERFQVALSDAGIGAVSEIGAETASRSGATGYGGAYGVAPMYGDFLGYSYGRMPICTNYACYLYSANRSYLYGLGGWNTYGGWGMYPGWGYGGPVTVIVRPTTPTGGGGGGGAPSSDGRVVKGRGYTPSGGTTGGTAQPRSETATSSGGASSTRSGASTSSSSGSGASTSSSSGSGEKSTTTRTAKPRNP